MSKFPMMAVKGTEKSQCPSKECPGSFFSDVDSMVSVNEPTERAQQPEVKFTVPSILLFGKYITLHMLPTQPMETTMGSTGSFGHFMRTSSGGTTRFGAFRYYSA